MIQFPNDARGWVIAIVSALVGFFFGGAIVAGTQRLILRFTGGA